MPQSVINRLPQDKRNLALQKISSNARRLRGGMGQNYAPILNRVGRDDSLEQLTVRMGIIPVITLPDPTSLDAYLQAMPPTRATGETITLAGPTTPQAFNPGDPLRECNFSAAGNQQAVTATSSFDASATGRGLADIPA